MERIYSNAFSLFFLLYVISVAAADDQGVEIAAKKILENLDKQQLKDALKKIAQETGLDINTNSSTDITEDEELLEALATAGDSLASANKNLETVAKRYMVKIYKPKCGEQDQCMQFRGRRHWQKCVCPPESTCRKVGPFWKAWKCVY